jgi:hypothetical protein
MDAPPIQSSNITDLHGLKLTRAIAEFQPIKACKLGWYGRCRVAAPGLPESDITPVPSSAPLSLLGRRRINGWRQATTRVT